jgi:hypothetical protein
MDGGAGVLETTITMTTDMIIVHHCPTLGGGGGCCVRHPRNEPTTLNYDLIPTSPTQQHKRLRKGGLCWEAVFVLGEHVARVTSAEWNGDGRGGQRWQRLWRRDCRQEEGHRDRGRHGALRPHGVNGSRLHHLAHQPAQIAGPDMLKCQEQLWDVTVVGGCNRLVQCAAMGHQARLCRRAIRRCRWGQPRHVAIQPSGICPDIPHIEWAVDKGLHLGEGLTCWAAHSLQGGDGEALHESAQG